MSKNNMVIREIMLEDNAQIEGVIRACFPEFNIPLKGTAYADPETKRMYQSYKNKNDVYYVIDVDGEILGGAGIKTLKGFKSTVCELQKMYFSPKIRGKGYGKLLFKKCIDSAKKMGYKQCYIESAPQLKAAIHIYESFGFKHLKEPLGDTGHNSCSIWMIKDLL
ncbi:GNAT family N-acetyltransferase [Lacinutrix venerupis]|uniref:GNAT family N-acetyltransferase n=1 Tax=Lacinutrix venerupis TaxID=1486034 RepID=A0AAC9LNJ1_9FLAO|nr:GNAT family N-acetyltransferase [Lacinutrix venerupis]APY00657.1 GNAT family N-acetyltransferase [Lacinutrix venerupis]